jgi:integrase/recombinase XerD
MPEDIEMASGEWPCWQVYNGAGQRKYVSREELEQFLRTADWREPSMRALCHVLAYTGCRITEALSLTRFQFDAERLVIVFKTLKRRREIFRAVPIPEDLAAQLLQLPIGEDGRFWTIHRSTAWRLFKEIMTLAGIVGPMASPKGLRHGFGISAASRNVPLTVIQRWMGHASFKTTAIYLDAVGAEEREFASRMWWKKGMPRLPANRKREACAVTDEQQRAEKRDGIWIDEATRREVVSLLRQARDYAAASPNSGGAQGVAGQIDALLQKLAR